MQQYIIDNLLTAAAKARFYAYAPYSHSKVGAAVLAENGEIFTGCNIENASLNASICAERVAIAKAASEGCHKLMAIAICGGVKPLYPCGICRQFLSEFIYSPDVPVICADKNGEKYFIAEFQEIMPMIYEQNEETID